MTKFERVAPAFAAKDYEGLVKFYRDALGFETLYKTGDYAILGRDAVEIHIYPQREGKVAGQGSAHFMVQGVNELFAACQHAVKVIHPLREHDYGLRDFMIEDPEGNRLDIGQRLNG